MSTITHTCITTEQWESRQRNRVVAPATPHLTLPPPPPPTHTTNKPNSNNLWLKSQTKLKIKAISILLKRTAELSLCTQHHATVSTASHVSNVPPFLITAAQGVHCENWNLPCSIPWFGYHCYPCNLNNNYCNYSYIYALRYYMGGSEKFWFYWKTKKYRAGVQGLLRPWWGLATHFYTYSSSALHRFHEL